MTNVIGCSKITKYKIKHTKIINVSNVHWPVLPKSGSTLQEFVSFPLKRSFLIGYESYFKSQVPGLDTYLKNANIDSKDISRQYIEKHGLNNITLLEYITQLSQTRHTRILFEYLLTDPKYIKSKQLSSCTQHLHDNKCQTNPDFMNTNCCSFCAP